MFLCDACFQFRNIFTLWAFYFLKQHRVQVETAVCVLVMQQVFSFAPRSFWPDFVVDWILECTKAYKAPNALRSGKVCGPSERRYCFCWGITCLVKKILNTPGKGQHVNNACLRSWRASNPWTRHGCSRSRAANKSGKLSWCTAKLRFRKFFPKKCENDLRANKGNSNLRRY